MKVLLDTNVVLWLADDPAILRRDTLDLLIADETVLVLSAVVPWEISIKWRSGKLSLPEHPRSWVQRLAREFGVQTLPVTQAHATEVADLPEHHRDPFDRLLIAQAQIERHTVVTADEVFSRYAVDVVAAR